MECNVQGLLPPCMINGTKSPRTSILGVDNEIGDKYRGTYEYRNTRKKKGFCWTRSVTFPPFMRWTSYAVSGRSYILDVMEVNEAGKKFVSEKKIMGLFAVFVIFALAQFHAFRAMAKFGFLEPWTPYSNVNLHKGWCPQARCFNSPACEPCKRRFLIIIATGRSGSTSLTSMLDRLPGVRMAGENNGQLTFVRKALDNLQGTKEMKFFSEYDITGAWKHHPIVKQSLACPIQKMFENINPPPQNVMTQRYGYDDSSTIIGFKTVRFHSPEREIENNINFLIENFPCARIVVNFRGDIEAQKRSWANAFGSQKQTDDLLNYNRLLVNIAAHLGQDRARLIDMSEWSRGDTAGLEVLNDLIDWLGFRDCKYPRLLHENKNGYELDRKNFDLGRYCRWTGN